MMEKDELKDLIKVDVPESNGDFNKTFEKCEQSFVNFRLKRKRFLVITIVTLVLSLIIVTSTVLIHKANIDKNTMIRRMNLSAQNIVDECYEQYSFFVDPAIMEKDKTISKSVNSIKDKFGKNAIFKGLDLLDEATQIERNSQIGGHAAGEEI